MLNSKPQHDLWLQRWMATVSSYRSKGSAQPGHFFSPLLSNFLDPLLLLLGQIFKKSQVLDLVGLHEFDQSRRG